MFEVIHGIVISNLHSSSPKQMKLVNAAGRNVIIKFGADPDICIYEEIGSGKLRKLVAIEVKSGSDFSNVHNRIGEAEKSHQKAKNLGFTECWTILNVPNMNKGLAKKESPSTDKFYQLEALRSGQGKEYEDFKSEIISIVGIRET